MHSFSDDLVERLKHISAEQMFERGIVSRAKKVGYICPFCRDGSGKDGTGMSTKSLEHGTSWFCGKCNVAYDNIHLLAQYFGKDYRRDFHEVISLAADLFNLQNDNDAAQDTHSATATFIPDKYKSFITNANNNLKKFVDAQGGSWRGLSFDTLNKFFCGFNPNCIGMKDEPPLPHVIIPTSFNQYLARLVGKPDDYHIADDIKINPKPHHGQKEIFGLKFAINDDPFIFLTEGEIDAMSIHQATGYNVVSVCGSALAANMRTQLKSITTKNFIVLFDNDKTGIEKRDLIVSALQFLNHNAIAADLSDKFKDANDFINKVRTLAPGSIAKLNAVRKGKKMTFNVKLAERPNTADGRPSATNESKNSSSGTDALKDFGISKVETLTDSLRRTYRIDSNSEGLVITQLERNSKASADGEIREGDLIIEVNGTEVKSPEDIKKAIGDDDSIVLMIEREGSTYFIMASKN